MKPSQELIDEWNGKLHDSGFNDIEYSDGTLSNFNNERGKTRNLRRQIDDNTEYYRLAGQYSYEPHLSEHDRAIWQLHADGFGERRIANALKLRESAVRRVIRIHKTLMLARLKLGKNTD